MAPPLCPSTIALAIPSEVRCPLAVQNPALSESTVLIEPDIVNSVLSISSETSSSLTGYDVVVDTNSTRRHLERGEEVYLDFFCCEAVGLSCPHRKCSHECRSVLLCKLKGIFLDQKLDLTFVFIARMEKFSYIHYISIIME